MERLDQRVAVVTGAGGGLGRALALELAARGADLALVDIDAAKLEATAALTRGSGRRVSLHRADVGDPVQMKALPEAVLAVHGRVDILVNNAGVNLGGTMQECSVEDLDWIVRANLGGVVLGCKLFLPLLLGRPAAHIVNISSLAALMGLPTQALYGATKAAVLSLSEALWAELAGTGVHVTCVLAGAIRTPLIENGRFSSERQRRWVQRLVGRFGMPSEHAARRIVDAMQRRRMRLLMGSDARLVELVKRAAPQLAHLPFALLGRQVLRRGPGGEPASDA